MTSSEPIISRSDTPSPVESSTTVAPSAYETVETGEIAPSAGAAQPLAQAAPSVEAANSALPVEASEGAAATAGAPNRYEYLLVIGPGRSGSDFLYRNLKGHPLFACPEIKEGHYYQSQARYAKIRSGLPAGKILADVANPAYADPGLRGGVAGIRRSGDRTLMVLLMRHHRDRAASIVRFDRARGRPSAMRSMQHRKETAMARGLTVRHLASIFDMPADVVVMDFDALTHDPELVMKELSRLCGGQARAATVREATNVSMKARFIPLSVIAFWIARALRALGMRNLLQRLKDQRQLKRMMFVPTDEHIEFSEKELWAMNAQWQVCCDFVAANTVETASGIRIRRSQS